MDGEQRLAARPETRLDLLDDEDDTELLDAAQRLAEPSPL